MSKIQKALKALSQSQKKQVLANVAQGGEAQPVNERKFRPQTDSSDSAGGVNARTQGHQMPESGTGTQKEPVPNNEIEIVSKDIEATGLLPGSRDIDAIEQQFKRIKRPVIKAAFDSDPSVGNNANVIMVTSALPGAGKSFCSFNLAQSMATDRDVGSILVDADVLKPGTSQILGLQDKIGLIDYLADTSVQLEDILVQTDLNDMIVIPAGRKHADATELLASRRMRNFVELLSKKFERCAVVFDTPPLLITNEAQALAEHMGQIVFVIEARMSSQDSVLRALGMLDPEKPINAILNKSRSAADSGYQSDDYGYYPNIQ